MSELVLVRIDDRLIHGQVVVKWLRHLGCNEIVIVDDGLYNDDDLKTVLRLAAPRGVRISVVPVHQAAQVVGHTLGCPSPAEAVCAASGTGSGQLTLSMATGYERRILLLVKAPATALALLQDGLSFDELNVGGLAGGEGTTRVYRSISVTREQMEVLQQIHSRGVHVYFQTVPDERAVDLSELIPVLEKSLSGHAPS